MKLFGTVESYDHGQGRGTIKPETSGKPIRFDKSAFAWENKSVPENGRRLSYEVSEMSGETRAVNLQHV